MIPVSTDASLDESKRIIDRPDQIVQRGLVLQPANPAMQPMIMDASLVQLQGVVVGVMRKY